MTTSGPASHRALERVGKPGRIGIAAVVLGSLAAGFAAALMLVAAPFIPATETALTGGLMLGFAVGWTLVAVLSIRFSDQPQRWAAAPAVFFGVVGGLLLIAPGPQVLGLLGWVWPPALLGVVITMAIGAHRRLRSRIRRWLVYPLLVVLMLASLAGGYETVQESIDASARPVIGELIDVGGHRLHLRCAGSGRPTVVLEPGLGETSAVMGWVAPAVAADTRVCVYDRAGRGWSEAADGPSDGVQTAADLHTLLHRAHVPGPFVLAGHSFGGLYVSSFAATYPDEVAGLVLLDSTSPDASIPASSPESGSYDLPARFAALLPAVAHLGVARAVAQSSYDSLPARSRDEARTSAATARYIKSYLDELNGASNAIRQAASLVHFDAKPLIVLTAGRGHDADWMKHQEQLATLSTNSRHRVIGDATHESLILIATDAAAVTQAIRDVVASVRSADPIE